MSLGIELSQVWESTRDSRTDEQDIIVGGFVCFLFPSCWRHLYSGLVPTVSGELGLHFRSLFSPPGHISECHSPRHHIYIQSRGWAVPSHMLVQFVPCPFLYVFLFLSLFVDELCSLTVLHIYRVRYGSSQIPPPSSLPPMGPVHIHSSVFYAGRSLS